jgi:hypothetical protein
MLFDVHIFLSYNSCYRSMLDNSEPWFPAPRLSFRVFYIQYSIRFLIAELVVVSFPFLQLFTYFLLSKLFVLFLSGVWK